MADSACLGLITGQMIGRWGNFINCEAFGRYTDCLFAMRIRRSIVNESMISQNLLDHLILDNGIEYIQVHPTFLYESLWNFGLLMFMLWFRKRKTFTGEMLCIYLAGYGIGRAWIEGLRTDSLLIPGYPDRGIPGIVCCAGDRLSCDPYLQQEKGFRPGKGSKLIWRAGKNW